MKIKNWWKKLGKYSIYFVIFSFLGALLEYLFGLIMGNPVFYFRSLYLITGLKIPFIPFYGGVFLILILFQNFLSKKKIPFYSWGLLNTILIISWELLWGLIGLYIFKRLIWDYSTHILNFMGIISLPMFLLWVAGGYVFSLIYVCVNKVLRKR
ncbi:hypothetical protein KAR52_03285 [Candidatus Pacearchaeota archaeon]|nr:hypothetical protein [Candidatus Pacearchaeota archaeon]